jgi:hypothetical protein
VVVGAEPDDPDAQRLHATRGVARARAALRAGAACLVITPVGAAQRPLAELELPTDPAAATDPADGVDTIDVGGLGDTYGAAGVLLTALAVARLRADGGQGRIRVVCGDDADGTRQLDVTPATGHGPDRVRT